MIACRTLKVVVETPEEVGLCDDTAERVVLGLSRCTFCLAQSCPDELRSFVAACNALDPKFRTMLHDVEVSCQKVVSFAEELHEILAKVLSESPPACKSRIHGYAGRNMVRKIVVSWLRHCLCDTAGHTVELSWDRLDYAAIDGAGAVADVNGKARSDIDSACGNVKASDLSDLLLGREDHALFVSMWACLFSEVAHRATDGETQTRILDVLRSSRAADVLDAFLLEHGVPPCPEVLVTLLLE